jgi:hypothetical protein
MKTLHLPLKAQWYDMIESGEKKEEYRELSPHWRMRIMKCRERACAHCFCLSCAQGLDDDDVIKITHVRFRYGYTKRTMLFKLDSVTIGKGRPEWGSPDHKVFILKLGERIE